MLLAEAESATGWVTRERQGPSQTRLIETFLFIETLPDAFMSVLDDYTLSDLVRPRGRLVGLLAISHDKSCAAATASHFRELDEPTLQFADFFKALCDIAEDGCRSNELSHLVMQQDNREFDGNAPAILGQSRHRQQVALAVMTFAGCHYPIVSRPMACSEIFRNDQIEGISDRFLCGKAENSHRPGVPKADNAADIGGDDRIRSRSENRLGKTARYARRFP